MSKGENHPSVILQYDLIKWPDSKSYDLYPLNGRPRKRECWGIVRPDDDILTAIFGAWANGQCSLTSTSWQAKVQERRIWVDTSTGFLHECLKEVGLTVEEAERHRHMMYIGKRTWLLFQFGDFSKKHKIAERVKEMRSKSKGSKYPGSFYHITFEELGLVDEYRDHVANIMEDLGQKFNLDVFTHMRDGICINTAMAKEYMDAEIVRQTAVTRINPQAPRGKIPSSTLLIVAKRQKWEVLIPKYFDSRYEVYQPIINYYMCKSIKKVPSDIMEASRIKYKQCKRECAGLDVSDAREELENLRSSYEHIFDHAYFKSCFDPDFVENLIFVPWAYNLYLGQNYRCEVNVGKGIGDAVAASIQKGKRYIFDGLLTKNELLERYYSISGHLQDCYVDQRCSVSRAIQKERKVKIEEVKEVIRSIESIEGDINMDDIPVRRGEPVVVELF